MNYKKGFTLIELLVVISIIALLSSIVLAALNDARAKGRDTARIRALNETRTALNMYFNDMGYYPQGSSSNYGNNGLETLKTLNYLKSYSSEIRYSAFSETGDCNNNTLLCKDYHIAIKLEKTNVVLKSDADLNYGKYTKNWTDGLSTSDCWTLSPDNPGDKDNDMCYDLSSI